MQDAALVVAGAAGVFGGYVLAGGGGTAGAVTCVPTAGAGCAAGATAVAGGIALAGASLVQAQQSTNDLINVITNFDHTTGQTISDSLSLTGENPGQLTPLTNAAVTTGLVAIEAVIGRFGPRVLDNIIDGRNVPTPPAMGAEQVDDLLHDIGELRGPNPNREILVNEDILIDLSHGLQTRSSGTFENVVNGQYLDPDSKYLYTIDEGGVNIALEQTPFDTPRGTIVHTNISDRAVVGGEAWFGPNNTVTINAGSGRFGDGAGITESQWNATIRYWENLGYTVNPIPFGQR